MVTLCPTHGLDAARELGALAYMRGRMRGIEYAQGRADKLDIFKLLLKSKAL